MCVGDPLVSSSKAIGEQKYHTEYENNLQSFLQEIHIKKNKSKDLENYLMEHHPA